MSRGLRTLPAGLLLAALAAGPAGAGPAAPAPGPVASAEQPSAWPERIGRLRSELDLAQERRDAAEAAVTRMRHRRHPRGEARKALLTERDAARTAYTESEQVLDRMLEEARRAGVPPGLLRAASVPPPAAGSEE